MVLCQYQFPGFDNYTMVCLCKMLSSGKAGQRAYRKSVYYSSNNFSLTLNNLKPLQHRVSPAPPPPYCPHCHPYPWRRSSHTVIMSVYFLDFYLTFPHCTPAGGRLVQLVCSFPRPSGLPSISTAFKCGKWMNIPGCDQERASALRKPPVHEKAT